MIYRISAKIERFLHAHSKRRWIKKFGLSGFVACLIGGVFVPLWAGHLALTLAERTNAVAVASSDLVTTAVAYAEFAAALADTRGSILFDASAQSAAGKKSVLSKATLDQFRTVMQLPARIQMQVAFISPHSNTARMSARNDMTTFRRTVDGMFVVQAIEARSRILVTASESENDALADWRHGAIIEGGGLALITLIIGLLGAFLVVQLRHREAGQADLIAAKDLAEAGTRAKSDFLANMSHEIRTPMNGILGMTSLLQSTALDEEQRRFVEVVQESGEALLTVVNDILDISKLEAGKLEIEIIDFDLVATVESAAALMAPKAREKRIDLGVFVEPTARGAYRGDPTRLRQILLNLLNNAIKFTEIGGVSIQVMVKRGETVGPDGSIVPLRFEVADTGMGMPESVRLRLFQKFTQGDTSVTRRFGGTGLGLAICKELVDLMHGEIGAESRAGVGSTFWFEIPFEKSAATIVDRDKLPEHFKTLKALIVDDIRMNIEIMGRQLKAFGMSVTGVDDGFAAIAELERAWHRGMPYDLVFLDQMMPGMAGNVLARRIRTSPHLTETKILIVSSAGRASISNIADLQLEGVLEKPVRHQELLDALINAYGKHTPYAERHARAADSAAKRPVMVASRPLRILLAEDNKINQQFASLLLNKAGHEVEVAENGHQAVDAVRRSDFDVVLMDIQMPELDGIEATHQIRALAPPKCSIPIIAMTANAMAGAREKYLDEGMDDYISKPVNSASLLSKLADIAAKTAAREPVAPVLAQGPAANDAVKAEPLVDLETLGDLEAVLPQVQLKSLIALYLADVQTHLAEIARCRAAGDFHGVSRQAHNIISMAGNLGAMQTSAVARRLETVCRSGDTAQAGPLIAELNKACASSSAAFEVWLNARSADTHTTIAV